MPIALIARLEAATGPDRELDARLHAVRNPTWRSTLAFFRWAAIQPNGQMTDTTAWRFMQEKAPPYTSSIDSALTLVPEGWGWKAESNLGFGHTVTVGHVGANKLYDRPEGWGEAATPALALCIASLKARASQEAPHAE